MAEDENKAPEGAAPIIDPAAAAAAPAVPPDAAAAGAGDPGAAPPGAPPDAPADGPKRTPGKRKPAPAKTPGWYATKAFRTQYQGVMLEFRADQLIDDETMAEWLADTGSPVDYLEG